MHRLATTVLFLFFVAQTWIAELQGSAAITFLVADLKYNAEEGVKICEIQQGAVSGFTGCNFLNEEPESFARSTLDLLEQFGHSLWSAGRSISDSTIKEELAERHVPRKSSLKQALLDPAFLTIAVQPLQNPDDITEYNILLLANPNEIQSLKAFKIKYPSVLILDGDTYHAWNKKLIMSKYFQCDPNLDQVKPRWKHYRKKLSDKQIHDSLYDFNTPFVVIKPVDSALGRGVIIIEREKLPKILKLIFRNPNKLAKHQDGSYKYWAKNSNKELIVEAFHSSDPVLCPHLHHQPFDGTMRIAFMMWRHEGHIEIAFIESYWKLPFRALSGEGTLNEKHKSYGKIPHFALVDPAIQIEVEEQLSQTMPILFQKMLEEYPECGSF